jgi:hypothetical protein
MVAQQHGPKPKAAPNLGSAFVTMVEATDTRPGYYLASAGAVLSTFRRLLPDSASHHFRPVVSFSLVVSENYYSGEWVGPAFSTEQEMRDFMQRNTPIGTKLSAQYKPNNPNMNLLDIDPVLWGRGRPITLGL